MERIEELARHLDLARLEGREVPRLTESGELTSTDAYLIMDEGIRLRETRGESVAGFKMGLTSEAKRRQMGLHEAIYGVLTDRMQVFESAPYPLAGQIHPKAEPEIAFRLSGALDGRQHQVTEDEAWAAVCEVAPAIEILDSRYVGFKYFSLTDVIADNASSSQFLIGEPVTRPGHWSEMENWRLQFSANGQPLHEALGSEISGSPIRSLTELVRLLASRERQLPAGSWVLAGAATAAVQLDPGMRIELHLQGSGFPSARLHLQVSSD